MTVLAALPAVWLEPEDAAVAFALLSDEAAASALLSPAGACLTELSVVEATTDG